ncbi:T9SS type A sorting domain-containing protein [Flavobacteriaceae bacterium]|nr:T9SS type A sorting domain-containing protein [Flavobacteriaceae bacterium]
MKQKYFLGISRIIFLFFLALFYSNLTNAQTTIYSEDFTGQNGQGATGLSTTDTSQVDWTIDISSATLSASSDWFKVTNEIFEARDVDGDAIWISKTINISGYSNVSFSLSASEQGTMEGTDIFNTEYKIGSGNWTTADTNGSLNDDFSSATVEQTGLTGSELVIRVIMNNGSGSEYHRLDDILVTGYTSTPTITYDSSSSSETETDATFNTSIPVTLSNYDADVTVSVTVDGSSTAESGDYTLNTSSLAFSSNGTQNISLDINNDTDSDDETIILNIAVSSGTADLGVSSHTVTITDDDLPSANISYSENFSDCSTHEWTVATVGAETEWICDSGYFEANAWGSSGTADDYLISPSFNMDTQTNEILSFNSLTQYADTSPQISLLYTTNYTGDPSTTTWVSSLSPTWPGSDSNVSTSSGNIDISSISGTAVHFAFRYTSTGTESGSTEKWRIDDISIGGTLSVTDDQTIASDINLDVDISSSGSLTLNSNSDINGDVTIADGGELTLNGTGTISGSVTISNGGSLIATDGSVTGNITYNRTLATTNWYLISSPVEGQDIDTFVAAEGLASGTNGSNLGLSDYNNTTPGWEYYQNGASGTGNFTSGDGRSIKLASTGDVSFTGTINTSDVTVAMTSNSNGFNLVGNPYPSYVAGNENADGTNNILTINSANLTENTLWFWNQSTGSYNQINQASTAFQIAPAQGFFVSATGSVNLSITEAMQSHQGTDSFQRLTTRPEIALSLSNGTAIRNADIYYIEGTTTGWDNGYDSSIFGGVTNEFAIYTHAVANGNGRNLGIQSLPPINYENMIIPVGINAESGTPITIDASTNNFPSGINIYLEDKQDNSFTLLEAGSNFSLTPENSLSGIGRFYLHTTSGVLSADDFDTNNNISIYTSSNDNLRIVGVQNGTSTVRLYNILGKEMLKISFEGNGVNDINLNTIPMGIYIVKLTTENGVLNRKIIIQ